MKIWVEQKLHNFEVVLYIINVEWPGGSTQVKLRFRLLINYYSWLIRKVPPKVRRALPPFPSKKIFNKSIVTIERRRLAIEHFFRILIRQSYIQKHMFLLKPVQLDKISILSETLIQAPVLSPDISDRLKSIAQFEPVINNPADKGRRNLAIKSLPEIQFTSPTVVSSLRPGGHRNVIPEVLGNYTLHWKLADCLEPQTCLYYATFAGHSFTIKIQHQEQGLGTLQEQHAIHSSLQSIMGVLSFVEFIQGDFISGIVLDPIPGTAVLLSDLELPLSLPTFLAIALSLTESLDLIHRQSIAYGALCPLTIWYDPNEEQVYFIDFCWCQVNNLIGNEEDIEWSNVLPVSLIPYIAPEHIRQSRVGNSGFRADLYSLGIILFQLITGRLPFDCLEKDQLLHAHLATKPHRADEISAEVPPVIGAIIDKLLQKEPSHRYATAHGVYSDFSLCKEYMVIANDFETGKEGNGNLQKKFLRHMFDEVTSTNIPEFELGRHDITDNFSIPDNLYQREKVLNTISHSIYDVEHKGEREIVILCGGSGTGKSKLISNVVQRLYHDIWFSLTVEFSQSSVSSLGENSEYLQNLFSRSGIQTQTIGHQILSRSKFEVDQWRDKISHIVAEDGELLLQYVPSLREVVGPVAVRKQKNAKKPIAKARKVSQLLCKFLTALAGPGHPLLLVLDSMQWANQQMFQLFLTLSSLPGLSHVIFLLSFRTDSPSKDNEKLRQVQKHCAQRNMAMTNLELDNLSLESIKELIEDAIGVSPSDSLLPLAKMIERKTCGNPLFVTQFLRSLYQENLLKFDALQRKWTWDADQIQRKPYTPNVIKFMIHEIDKLSSKQRELLHLASCIGSEFDLVTLTEVMNSVKKNTTFPSRKKTIGEDKSSAVPSKRRRPRTEIKRSSPLSGDEDEEYSVDDILSRCLFIAERDLLSVIINHNDDLQIQGFAFTHEQIHKAAYQSQQIKFAGKIHLLIGKYWLEEHRNEHGNQELIPYRIVHQLNNGRSYIKSQELIMEVVQYNQEIAKKSVNEEAYDQAVTCATVAIELLVRNNEKEAWKANHNAMMKLSVILYAHQTHEDSQLFCKLMKLTRSKVEKVQLFSAKLDHYRLLNDMKGAVAIAKSCIHEILRIPLADDPSFIDIRHMHEELRASWSLNDVDLLSDHSLKINGQFNGARYAEDQLQLRQNIQRLMSHCIDISMQENHLIIIQLSIQSAQWSLQWGITEDSLVGLIIYAVACIHSFNDIPFALHIEKLLIVLEERFPQCKSLIVHARLQWFHYLHNFPLTRGLHSMNCMEEDLWDSYRDYLSRGQTHNASHILGVLACNSFFTCESLEQSDALLSKCSEYCQSSSSSGDIIVHSILQAIGSLVGENENKISSNFPNSISVNLMNDASSQTLCLHYCTQMKSCFLLGEVSQSHKAMQYVQQHHQTLFGRTELFFFWFWASLILSASIETFRRIHCSTPEASSPDLTNTINDSKTVMESITLLNEYLELMKPWNERSPVNFGHCIDLIAAEQQRISGKYQEACDLYRSSIVLARTNNFTPHEAIAHEQLGRLMILMGKKSPARYCLLDAIRCYRDWGAKQKVTKLETQFASLLSAQLQSSKLNEASGAPGNKKSGNSFSDLVKDTGRLEKQFKLTWIVTEALQTGIGLGSALKKIWKEICVHTGAERGCLALYRQRHLLIEVCNDDTKIQVLQSSAVSNHQYCVSVMNYVTTSKVSVIIDDCLSESTFLGDPYVRKKKIRSLFCIPILVHDHIIGVFYLENSLVSGLFTDYETPLMSTIALQLAMAITNDYLASSLGRQIAENRVNPPAISPGSNQFKALVSRRIDHLLGYSWERCLLLLTENHLLIHEPEATKSSQPLARYAIEQIQQVDQVSFNEISDSSTPPTEFILRVFLNNRKLKLFFAMSELRCVQEWIKAVSIAIKQQPQVFDWQQSSDTIDRTIKLWEDEVELGAVIGRGSTSCIYSATWHGMKVAVKMFFTSMGMPEDEESEFIKEVRILQTLRHPAIILFIGAYFTKEGPCVVTELMKVDLFNYLHKEKLIDLSLKIRWAEDITNGMIYLHSFFPPIVHRDLKSLNILLDENLNAKVADLGLARHYNRNMTDQLGTPAWMAPEVFSGGDYSTSADVYSFGIILWEIYTQEEPFKQFNFSVEIGNQVGKGLRPVIPKCCPPAWKELMQLCWAHEPESRPSFKQVLHYIRSHFSQ